MFVYLKVRDLVESVNSNQGFRIKGWFKPAITENGVTQEIFTVHACYMAPNEALTPNQRRKMYQGLYYAHCSSIKLE